METQLQELIDKIKDEGVREAERKAAHIIREAEEKASALLAQAKVEAQRTALEAERREAQAVERGATALKQAGRDLLLKMRERLGRLFDNLLRRDLQGALQGNLLGELAVKAVAAFQPAGGDGIRLQVSEGDAERLAQHLRASLSREAEKGIVITPVDGIDAGFRISGRDGAVFHDITDSGLAEVLGAFVNPRLAALLTEAAGPKEGNP